MDASYRKLKKLLSKDVHTWLKMMEQKPVAAVFFLIEKAVCIETVILVPFWWEYGQG